MPPPIKREYYDTIFRTSSGSSIPILELSDTDEFINLKSSEINYSDVFSGGDGQAIGVSYQDLLSANVRTQSAVESPSKRTDRPTIPEENQLFPAEAPSVTFDDKKHFNMSYHKTSAGSQDGSNGTIHVAQFHPEPGFTTFVDDNSPQESKADKPDLSVTSDIHRKLDFSDRKPEDMYTKKAMQHIDAQGSGRKEAKSRTRFQQDASISSDKLLNEGVVNLRPHRTKKRLPLHVAENNNDFTKRSTVSKSEAPKGIAHEQASGDGSLPFISEELDVNSAAAISIAALKDAIQKAQKIIQIAKKLMERKKGGLQWRSNQVFKDYFRVEVRKQNPIAHKENRPDNINAKDTCDYVDSLLNAFSWSWKSALRRGQDDLYFRTSTSGKVTNAQNRATNEKREPALSTVLHVENNREASPEQQVIMNKHEYEVGERNLTRETLMKQEVNVEKVEDNEKAHESGFIKKRVHAVVMDNELESSANKLAKDAGMKNPLMSQEDGDCEKIEIEYKQKIEDERKFESVVLKNSDSEKMTCKTQKQDHNQWKVNLQQHSENTTASIKEEPEHRPRTICDEDLEERFEDASEWVQNEDEPKDSLGSASNENEKNTYMAEVIWGERRLAEFNKLTIEEKRSIDFNGRKEIEENYGMFELKGSGNGYGSCDKYENTENIQTGTKKLEALRQSEYECTVNRESDPLSHDASDIIRETQGACQPYMFDESSKAKEQVNDNSRSIDRSAKEFSDFRECEAEEAKVIYKVHKIEHSETVGSFQGANEENEDKKVKNVFEVISSEGSLPGFGLTDSDLEHKEDKQRNKDFKSNINPDNGAQISVIVSVEKDNVFKEAEINRAEEAVKDCPVMSNGEGHVVISKNFKAYPGSILSSVIEKVIQVDEGMTERHKTHMNGDGYGKTIEDEKENTKEAREMETEVVVKVDKEGVAMKDTKTEKAFSKGAEENEYLKKNHEKKKGERQSERDRIAVETAMQEARARAVAGARERAERAAVERATAEVRQRMMAEARGKLEKSTTAAKPPAEKALVDAKLRSERAAVERATAEARARALEKALSKKPTRDTAIEDLRKSDVTYIESAQRSKARLEREERIMERAAKALAEKNMRDLFAQKEEAEKNRLAESLDAEIKRWSIGKEGNLRALLSTLQYILGPGSGWQPISLTDIVMSNAVKKAYRKATLHVHPDKLQQRGASIREKYICEKVFDLLKVAWNKFSSEER